MLAEFGRRAGFALDNIPWAADPRVVAAEALRALGRRTVLVSGRLRRAAYAPVTLPRAAAARGLGLMIGMLSPWQSRSEPTPTAGDDLYHPAREAQPRPRVGLQRGRGSS